MAEPIEGTYTAVEVRELKNLGDGPRGCVFILAFQPVAGAEIRVFISVNRANPHPLLPFARLLASMGVPEPSEGWNAALCPQVTRNYQGASGVFDSTTGLHHIHTFVLNKAATVVRHEDRYGASYPPGPPFNQANVLLFPSVS